jgi:outer membrane protein OmpA-like peptidoglycan-associated protein
MKKRLILVLLLLASLPLLAQENFFELSLHVSGGSSTFKFNPSVGEIPTLFQSPSLGGNAGLGGIYFFRPSIGLRTGIEMGIYRSEYNNKLLEAKDNLENPMQSVVQNDYSEKYKAYYLNIPLMLQLQTSGEKNRLYAAVGVKMGIPMNTAFEATNSSAKINYDKGQTEDTNAFSTKGNLSLKTAFSGAVEAGMKWKLSDKMSLQTGFYVDFGLNDTKKPGDPLPLVYKGSNIQEFKQNSIVDASYSDRSGKQVRTEKFVPFAAGFKVAFSFGFKKKEKMEVTNSGYIVSKITENKTPTVKPKEEIRPVEQKIEKEEHVVVTPVVENENPDIAARKKESEANLAKKQEQLNNMTDVWEIHRKGEEEANKFREAKARKTAEVTIEMKILGYKKGQTILTDIHKRQLDEKVVELNKYPDIKIRCTGHTCDFGTDDVNQRVGMSRAEAAKQYLIEKGIDPDRITVETKGKNEALLPNTDEENRLRNRRIEFLILREE